MLVNPITNFTNYSEKESQIIDQIIYIHTLMTNVRIIPKFCIKEIYILKILLKLGKPF